jgi:hypothetical protein
LYNGIRFAYDQNCQLEGGTKEQLYESVRMNRAVKALFRKLPEKEVLIILKLLRAISKI